MRDPGKPKSFPSPSAFSSLELFLKRIVKRPVAALYLFIYIERKYKYTDNIQDSTILEIDRNLQTLGSAQVVRMNLPAPCALLLHLQNQMGRVVEPLKHSSFWQSLRRWGLQGPSSPTFQLEPGTTGATGPAARTTWDDMGEQRSKARMTIRFQ